MKPCVLIVDDSLTVRMDLKEAMEAAGFDTITSATIASARRACQQGTFDLAILDVLLPDGDGLTLLQEIKAAPGTADRPVLLLSSEDEVRDRVRGLKTGADDYVGKPYDVAQVVARARELVQRRRTRTRERPLIVVIEDSPTFAAEMRASLEAAGYEVATGISGEEGLRLAADLRPDAVVADQILPGIDGPEVIRRLRADAALRRTPCLLLTASENRADELRALEAGADAFSQKHAGAPVVLAKLAALLRTTRETAGAAALPSLLAPKRILAVDDSATFLGELCDQLRAEGYDVVAAHSGAEALELLGTQPVDGILLDLLMPVMSGQETCRRIKAEPAWRDIPLVILTALDESAAMIEGINAGADDYIAKSGDFEILKARLRAQLRRKQFEDENRDIREQLHRREMEAVETQALRELAEGRATLIATLEQKNADLLRTNEELQKAKDAVEFANKELESFSYSVSHDLRSPLRHIDGFTGLLAKADGHLVSDRGRHYLAQISDSARQMGMLIDDLLIFSRMARSEMNIGPVDLQQLVDETIQGLSPETQQRNIRWERNALPVMPGDRSMLRQVFVNLLSNAVKYTRPRDPAVIEIGCQDETAHDVVVFVRDNGVGFDMEFADKLFGIFQRLHRAEDFEGTGIGLANVRRIITRHGGRTWAESKPDSGATLFFSLPKQKKPQP